MSETEVADSALSWEDVALQEAQKIMASIRPTNPLGMWLSTKWINT